MEEKFGFLPLISQKVKKVYNKIQGQERGNLVNRRAKYS
jgi:hypothetical protein